MKPSDFLGKAINIKGVESVVYDTCNPYLRIWSKNETHKYLFRVDQSGHLKTIKKTKINA